MITKRMAVPAASSISNTYMPEPQTHQFRLPKTSSQRATQLLSRGWDKLSCRHVQMFTSTLVLLSFLYTRQRKT
jgi:hypothetical protein